MYIPLKYIFLIVLSHSSFANTEFVNFQGSITNITCDFIGEQDGIERNTIKLGDYNISDINNNNTDIILFSLNGRNIDGSPCTSGDYNHVDITWHPQSGQWINGGLKNSGTAKGVAISLMNMKGDILNSKFNTVSYPLTGDSELRLPFLVQIQKIDSVFAGTIKTAATFSISYK
ncbi:fimbrial protein [Photobacterium piscicola]|uniref:fimbrial protein n=1 Tax=Photobacterium piscicola TaxID=1378299 RepID=UPI0037353A8B